MQLIKISENRFIGEDQPAFIVAEAGSNHNQDKSLAFELVDAACEAGADAVKFQIFKAKNLYSKKTPGHSKYDKNLFDLIKEIELPRDWVFELKEYCDKKGIIFFATPFDFEAIELLEKANVLLYKIASFEIVDLKLIKKCAKTGKPLIISTGLANMEEIEDAYVSCIEEGNRNIVLLQCASVYPASPNIMNLKSILTLKNAFNCITGLSDHTTELHVAVAAVAMGAKVIEKHFTMSKKLKGPDHPFALEPHELKEMIRQIREVESAMGDGLKLGPSKEEEENYRIGRRSIHARCDIKEGEEITEDKIIVKRPGFGIKPKFLNVVVGKKAKKFIPKDSWISWDMI